VRMGHRRLRQPGANISIDRLCRSYTWSNKFELTSLSRFLKDPYLCLYIRIRSHTDRHILVFRALYTPYISHHVDQCGTAIPPRRPHQALTSRKAASNISGSRTEFPRRPDIAITRFPTGRNTSARRPVVRMGRPTTPIRRA